MCAKNVFFIACGPDVFVPSFGTKPELQSYPLVALETVQIHSSGGGGGGVLLDWG